MTSKKRAFFVLAVAFSLPIQWLRAQPGDIGILLREFEARAAAGTTPSYEEAEAAIEAFQQASRETVAATLPIILQETTSQYVAVRRVAAMALYLVTSRPEERELLSTETGTFGALLVDSDIPIRRVTGMALDALHLDDSSPLLPVMAAYLSREDAVSTIGGGIAGLLMKAAPTNAEATDAVVRYMGRKDHTQQSRSEMLQSISVVEMKVKGFNNRGIGRALAKWADDTDEQTSIEAIRTLRGMGMDVVSDNQQTLSAIAVDPRRAQTVRDSATKALSGGSFPVR